MKSSPCILVACLTVGLLTVDAAAESTKGGRLCPQSLAGYGTPDQTVMLEFAGSSDGAFRLLLGDEGGPLEGFVYPGEDDGDNEAVVLNNCPEGDATGEELAACTIWKGPIIALAEDGNSEPFPTSDQPAAGFLRLEGFADALNASQYYKQTGLPARNFDRLTLLACQE